MSDHADHADRADRDPDSGPGPAAPGTGHLSGGSLNLPADSRRLRVAPASLPSGWEMLAPAGQARRDGGPLALALQHRRRPRRQTRRAGTDPEETAPQTLVT